MSHDSIVEYVNHLGRALKRMNGTDKALTESLETRMILTAVKRRIGAAKQRARAITPGEIRNACANVRGDAARTAAFRLITLVAFFGAFRLGQLLPRTPDDLRALDGTSRTMLLSDLTLDTSNRRVLVRVTRSKTNIFREKERIITLQGCPTDPTLCVASALESVILQRSGSPNIPLAHLHRDIATVDSFVHIIRTLVSPQQPTALEKGVITGHSFRRGFTRAALAAGFSLEQIMTHGDWSHPDSVLDSYAVGSLLPSIPLAHFLEPRAPLVHPAPSLNHITEGRQETFRTANPYAIASEFIRVSQPTDAHEMARQKRAREWEKANEQ